MKYLFAEDEHYYTPEGKADLLKSFKGKIEEIISFPTREDLKRFERKNISSVALLAPYLPGGVSPELGESLVFDIIYLPNMYGLLTTGQKRENMSTEMVLERKLGVKMERPTLTMKDYGGAEELHSLVRIVKEKFKHGMSAKGFLLAGIPGTGKSYFAKTVAGELGYILVSLNLSAFMEKEDTIYAIQNFFDFFENNTGDYVLWLDEIEKMFVGEKSQQVMGQLLTSINEANTHSKSNFFIIATANNVSEITKKNPEFFRSGRFDMVIFLLNPTLENAVAIFTLYINKQRKELRRKVIPYAIYHYVQADEKDEDNRVKMMAKQFLEDQATHSLSREILLDVTSAEMLALCQEDPAIMNAIEKVAEKFEFEFDIDTFIRISMSLHRDNISQKDRYAYTPAEIEFIIVDSFNRYYLLDPDDHDYAELSNRYRPLQVNIKDSIKDMLSKASNFIQI